LLFLSQNCLASEPILVFEVKKVPPQQETMPYRPYAVKFDHQGRIIVGDPDKKEILIFDKQGKFIKSFGKEGRKEGEFLADMGGIAIDSQNRIYVVDTHNSRIQVFDAEGNFLFQFGEVGSEKEKFSRARGIAVDVNGKIYVTDQEQGNIKMFDNQGHFLKVFIERDIRQGKLDEPEWIVVDKTGKIYVTHHGGGPRINVYDSAGNFILNFAPQGQNPGEIFKDVEGIATDSKGHMFAVDEDDGRVEVYAETGRYLFSLGKGIGSGPGEFLSPKGIDFDAVEQLLVVTDSWNSRIQIFDVKDIFER